MDVRRAEPLLIEWADKSWVVHDIRKGRSHRVSRDVIRMLQLIEDGAKVVELASEFDEEPAKIEGYLRKLTDIGLLTTSDGAAPDRDVVQELWGSATKHFHMATRDADFITQETEDAQRYYETTLAQGPRPTYTKEYQQAPHLPLPRVHDPLKVDLRHVLESRRTHRAFTRKPVTVDQLSTILHYSFAPLRHIHTENWGTMRLKAYPAGGARNETEAYVVPLNVADVPIGVYHYNTDRHALESLEKPIDAQLVEHLTGYQKFCGQSGFVVFVTAVAYRFAAKYQHPRAYRIMMVNLGHLGQVFAMVATGLGLGPYQTVAFRDSEVEALLGVDPDEEFSCYVLGAGNPLLNSEGLPNDYEPAQVL